MALFGDEDGDVGPFVMSEGGEEWFPFTLDNLEMDRACSLPQEEARAMDQDGDDGETDQDADIDGGPSAEASGPGPPQPAPPDGTASSNGWNTFVIDRNQQQQSLGMVGDAGVKLEGQARRGGLTDVVGPEPKPRLDKVKPEAKEVHASHDRKRHTTTETTAPAKRSSRDKSGDKGTSGGGGGGGGSSSSSGNSKSKQKRRLDGGMAGGLGGTTAGKAEGQNIFASASASSEGKNNTSSRVGGGSGGGGGGERRPSKAGSGSAAGGGGSGNGGSSAKQPAMQNKRRLERNAREQKRSLKISQRIEDLRRMLSQFGVDVKTSKSAVLSEATDYIAHLQRQQAQSEAERARILQLLYNARSGAAAAAAAAATAGGGGGGGGGRATAGLPFATTAVTPGPASGPTTGVATTTAAHGRTAKPPPPGAPLGHEARIGGPASAPGSAATAATAAAMQPQQQQQIGDGGFCEEGLEAQVMMSGSLISLAGDSDLGRAPSAATAGTAGSAAQQSHQREQQQLEVAPGFRGISAAARSGVDGIMPLHPSAAAGRVVGDAADSGIGETAATAAMANLGATARALSHVNYERVFRTAPMPMAIANVNGNLVDCNARLSQATGFRRDEVLFMTIFDLVADPFLQHTFSMISSILSMRGVTNAPFFQVPGKLCNGGPGGIVQISAVHDEQLRPMHFCICILDSPTTTSSGAGGTPAAAGVATASAVGAGGNSGVVGTCNGISSGSGLTAGSGGGNNGVRGAIPGSLAGGSRGGGGTGGGNAGSGGVVRITGNVG